MYLYYCDTDGDMITFMAYWYRKPVSSKRFTQIFLLLSPEVDHISYVQT